MMSQDQDLGSEPVTSAYGLLREEQANTYLEYKQDPSIYCFNLHTNALQGKFTYAKYSENGQD